MGGSNEPSSSGLQVTGYEVASLGRGTRMQEGCKLFGCAEEPTQVKEGGMVEREATTTTTMTMAAATTTTTRHQWQRLTKRWSDNKRPDNEGRQQQLRLRWKCRGNPLFVQG